VTSITILSVLIISKLYHCVLIDKPDNSTLVSHFFHLNYKEKRSDFPQSKFNLDVDHGLMEISDGFV